MMIQINGVYPLIYKVYFLENVHTSILRFIIPVVFYRNKGGKVRHNTTV